MVLIAATLHHAERAMHPVIAFLWGYTGYRGYTVDFIELFCNPSVLPWGYRGYSTGFERDRLKVEPNVAHQVAACGALFFGLQPATWPATYTTALLQPPMQKGCHF